MKEGDVDEQAQDSDPDEHEAPQEGNTRAAHFSMPKSSVLSFT